MGRYRLASRRVIGGVTSTNVINLKKTYFPARIGLYPPPSFGTRYIVVGTMRYRPCLATSRRLVLRRTRRMVMKITVLVGTIGIGGTFVNVRGGGPSTVRLVAGITSDCTNVRIIPLGIGCPRKNRGRLVSTVAGHRITDNTLPVSAKTIIRGMNATFTMCRTMRGGGPLFRHIVAIANGSITRPSGFLTHVNAPVRRLVSTYNNLPRSAKGVVNNNPVVNGTLIGASIPATGKDSKVLVVGQGRTGHKRMRGYVHYTGYIDTYPVKLRPCLLSTLTRGARFREVRSREVVSYVRYNSYRFAYPTGHPLLSCYHLNGKGMKTVVHTHRTGGWWM